MMVSDWDTWEKTLDPAKRQELNSIFRFETDKVAARQRFAAVAHVSAATGADIEDVSRRFETWYMPAFAADEKVGFGRLEGVKDSNEFYGLLKGRADMLKTRNELFTDAAGAALESVLVDGNAFEDFATWQAGQDHEDAYGEKALEVWKKARETAQSKLGADGLAIAKRAVRAMRTETGVAQENDAWMNEARRDLIRVKSENPEKYNLILGAMMRLGKAAPKSDKGVVEGMGEQAGRVLGDMATGFADFGTNVLRDASASLAEAGITNAENPEDLAAQIRAGRDVDIDLDDLKKGVIDPIKSERDGWVGWIENAAYGLSSSGSIMVAARNPFGQVALTGMFADESYNDFRQAGWTGAGAASAAVVSGVFQTGVEYVSELAIKIPGVSGVMAKFGVKPGSSWASQFFMRSGLRTGAELGEEAIQQATAPFIQEMVHAITESIPDRPEGQKLKDVMSEFMKANQFMPLVLSVLPMGMIGAGMSTSQDMAVINAVTSNDKLLRAVFSEEDAAAIKAEADPDKRQAMIQEKWVATPIPQIVERARAVMEEETNTLNETRLALQEAESRALIPTIRKDSQGWTVTDNQSGSTVRVGSRDEAVRLAYESLDEMERKSAAAMAQTAEEFLNLGGNRAEAIEINQSRGTLQREVDEGRVTPEQASRAVELYGMMHGLTPQEARAERVEVLGNNIAEWIEGVRTAVSRIWGGGNLITVMHEGIHGRWRAGLERGHYTQAMGVQWVRMAERASGQQFLPVSDDGQVTADMLDEAIVEVATADLIGKRKDSKQHFTPGLISRGVASYALSGRANAKAAGKLATFLKAWREFWGKVLKNAKALKKARAEGKLGEDFDSFLDDLMGTDPQKRFEVESAKEAVEMAGDIDNAPFSLAPRSLAEVSDTVLASRMKRPEFREALFRVAREKLDKIRTGMDAIAGRVVDKTEAEWNREMKAREGFEYDRILRETFGADTTAKQEALPVVDRQAARSEARTFAKRWLADEKSKIPTEKERQMAALRTLDAILSAFPAEIRGQVGGFVKPASLGSDKAREAEIEKRLEKLDKVVEKAAKKHYLDAIEKVFDKSKPKKGKAGEKPKGKLGAQTQALVDLARAFSELDEAGVSAERAAIADRLAKATDTATIVDLAEREQLLDLFGAMDERTSAELEAAAVWLADTYQTGRNRWRAVIEQRETEAVANREQARKEIGKLGLDAEQQTALKQAKTIKKASGGMALSWLSFEQVMSSILGRKSKLARDTVAAARAATNQKTDALRSKRKAFKEAMSGIFGGVKQSVWQGKLYDLQQIGGVKVTKLEGARTETRTVAAEAVERIINGTASAKAFGLDALTLDKLADAWADNAALPANRQKKNLAFDVPIAGTATETELSQLQAVHLSMMARQTAYTEVLAGHGWTAEVMDSIEKQLTPEAKAIRDWLSEQYRGGWEPLNQVYARMYGVNLPRIPNYAPGTFEARDMMGQDLDPYGQGLLSEGGFRAGMLKTRGKHNARPRLEDALSVYWGHVNATEHFQAFAEFARDLRAVMNNAEVRASITAKGGKDLLQAGQSWIEAFERNGLAARSASSRWDEFLRRRQASQAYLALAYNMGTLMKQSTAALGSLLNMGPGQAARQFAKLVTNQLDLKAAYQSEVIQRRLDAGYSPEVRQAMAAMMSEKPTWGTGFVQKGMEIIGMVDAIFTTASYAMAYDFHLSQAKAAGLSSSQAQAMAGTEAEATVARTAQPAEMMDRSLGEIGMQPMAKFLFMFASEARQKAALALDSYAALWSEVKSIAKLRGSSGQLRGDLATRLLLLHVVFPLAIQTITNLWRDARDDDDDELFDSDNWRAGDYAKSMLLGPALGIPLIGQALNAAFTPIFGGHFFANDPTQPLNRALSGGDDIIEAIQEGDLESGLKGMRSLMWALALAMGGEKAAAVGAGTNILYDAFRVTENLAE